VVPRQHLSCSTVFPSQTQPSPCLRLRFPMSEEDPESSSDVSVSGEEDIEEERPPSRSRLLQQIVEGLFRHKYISRIGENG